MIEVTQKDLKGRIQTLGFYTEEQFGNKYRWEREVLEQFDTEHKMIGSREELIGGEPGVYYREARRVAIFSLVAYNEKGKVLDPTYLLGLIRAGRRRWKDSRNYRWGYNSWSKSRWHRGVNYRQLHTTPERRATFACEDQEEHAPKVRTRRNASHLPNTWDDYCRFNQKNWKKFRKHQWRD